jgi:1-deoxy-D-xylulose-5-phosphate reductoisomerase
LLKQIAILGSTGSIGEQTLEVVRNHTDKFKPIVLTARSNHQKLLEQALEFKPAYVVIGCRNGFTQLASQLSGSKTKVLYGKAELEDIVTLPEIDAVVIALVGYAGLKPLVKAIETHKDIALANKESLVVAGRLVMESAKNNNVKIIPVDSEHSAIYQCLAGESYAAVEKIYLTASGGPFFGSTKEQLENVTAAQALCHPNWSMGAKITIDSATMMNKGLEVIEARWLFDLSPGQIDVIIHPQSIVHSLVQFIDGSIKAQMGLPDMKLPIQYALSSGQRIESNFPRFDFLNYPQLTFAKPDLQLFRNLALAYHALQTDGNMPCILNAANEIAVEAFLDEKIAFNQIPNVVEQCMQKSSFIPKPGLAELSETNKETKRYAKEFLIQYSK